MRCCTLDPEDRAASDGIPVTSVARTLFDLAPVLHPSRLARAAEEAERLELFDLAALRRLCVRSSGRRGIRALRAVLATASPPDATRSELERNFAALCARAGLPAPSVNQRAADLEVDAMWPDARLIVELDGFAFHKTRQAFERDRFRDARLQLSGYRVLRLTARRISDEPEAVVATIRRLLTRRD